MQVIKKIYQNFHISYLILFKENESKRNRALKRATDEHKQRYIYFIINYACRMFFSTIIIKYRLLKELEIKRLKEELYKHSKQVFISYIY